MGRTIRSRLKRMASDSTIVVLPELLAPSRTAWGGKAILPVRMPLKPSTSTWHIRIDYQPFKHLQLDTFIPALAFLFCCKPIRSFVITLVLMNIFLHTAGKPHGPSLAESWHPFPANNAGLSGPRATGIVPGIEWAPEGRSSRHLPDLCRYIGTRLR